MILLYCFVFLCLIDLILIRDKLWEITRDSVFKVHHHAALLSGYITVVVVAIDTVLMDLYASSRRDVYARTDDVAVCTLQLPDERII